MRALLPLLLLLAAAAVHAAAEAPAVAASAPVLSQSPAAAAAAVAAPTLVTAPAAVPAPASLLGEAGYEAALHTDFVGRFEGLPANPTEQLKRSIVDDKQYIASIMRMPMDMGDPANCDHTDLENDERDLRMMALRINHRRTAMRQTDQWIRSATEGLAHIESEIANTHKTAKNLAEQLDALEAQRGDIVAHIHRNAVLDELANEDATLMRLKDARMKREVGLQKRHNEFALRNHKHNQVLAKLQQMRTKQGLALGKLDDPKPYRFAQAGMEDAAAQQENAAQAQAEAEQNQDTAAVEVDAETEEGQAAEAQTADQLLAAVEAGDKEEQAIQAAEEAAEAEEQ